MRPERILLLLSAAILLAGLIAASFAQPRIMTIYQNKGVIDTISTCRIDTITGITIHENMLYIPTAFPDTLKARDSTDSIVKVPTGDTLMFCLGSIDSITFPIKGGPAYEFISPARGEVLYVGETLTVEWRRNPLAAGFRAFLTMSLDAGRTYNDLTPMNCFMLYPDSTYAGMPCSGSYNYPPYPYITSTQGMIGTWKCRITDPLATPDPMMSPFSPISDSVVLRICDYDNGCGVPELFGLSGIFSIRR